MTADPIGDIIRFTNIARPALVVHDGEVQPMIDADLDQIVDVVRSPLVRPGEAFLIRRDLLDEHLRDALRPRLDP